MTAALFVIAFALCLVALGLFSLAYSKNLATKQDLNRMEERLTDTIAKNANITPAIVAAAMRLWSSLDKLDATVPDQQK